MSRSQNSLITSDVVTTPIKLKYSSSYTIDTLEAVGMTVLSGVNGPVTITGSVPEETLNYYSVRNLYYSNYLTGSFPVSSSAAENYLMSTAASGTFDADLRYFPTESGAHVTILSVPRNVFGEKLSRRSFIISSSAYYIKDDGNGNLVDYANGNAHVGNIIYNQGMVILTNVDYQEILFLPTTTTTTTTTVPPPTTTSTTTTTTTVEPTTTTTTTTEAPTTTTTTTTTIPPTTTSTTTTTTTACPCVCGVTITNTSGGPINYSYQDCYDVTYTGSLSIGQTFQLTCPDPAEGNVKNNSVTTTGGATVTYGSCQPPAPTTTTSTTTTTIPPTTTTTIAPTTTSTTTTTTTIPPTTTTTTTTSTTTTTTTVPSVQHFRSVTPQIDSSTACGQSTPTSVYTSVGDSTMSNGVTFYTDSNLTTPFNGASQWWKILWKGAVGFDDEYGVQINSSGVVIAFNFCPAPTTTSTTTTTSTAAPAPSTTTTSTTTTSTTAGITAYSHGIVYCDTTTDTIISTNALIRFDYYYDSSANQCFQVVTNASVVAGPGQTYTSVADCNDPSCTL